MSQGNGSWGCRQARDEGVGGTGGIERDLLVVLLTEELIGGIFF